MARLLVCAAVLVAAGCGGGSPTGVTPPGAAPAAAGAPAPVPPLPKGKVKME